MKDQTYHKLFFVRPKGKIDNLSFGTGVMRVRLKDLSQYRSTNFDDYVKHLLYRYSTMGMDLSVAIYDDSEIQVTASDIAFASRLGILVLIDEPYNFVYLNMTVHSAVSPSGKYRISQPDVPVVNAGFIRNCVYDYCQQLNIKCISLGDTIGNTVASRWLIRRSMNVNLNDQMLISDCEVNNRWTELFKHYGHTNKKLLYDPSDIPQFSISTFRDQGLVKGYRQYNYDSHRYATPDPVSRTFWRILKQFFEHQDLLNLKVLEPFPGIGVDSINCIYAGFDLSVSYDSFSLRNIHTNNCFSHGVGLSLKVDEGVRIRRDTLYPSNLEDSTRIEKLIQSIPVGSEYDILYLDPPWDLYPVIDDVFTTVGTNFDYVVFKLPERYPINGKYFTYIVDGIKFVLVINKVDRIFEQKYARRFSEVRDFIDYHIDLGRELYRDSISNEIKHSEEMNRLLTRFGLKNFKFTDIINEGTTDYRYLQRMIESVIYGIPFVYLDSHLHVTIDNLDINEFVNIKLEGTHVPDLLTAIQINSNSYRNYIDQTDYTKLDFSSGFGVDVDKRLFYCGFSISNTHNSYDNAMDTISRLCNNRGIVVVPNYNVAHMFRYGEYDVQVVGNLMSQRGYSDWLFHPSDFVTQGFGVCSLTDFPFKLLSNKQIEGIDYPFTGNSIFNELWMVIYDMNLTQNTPSETYSNINSIRQKSFTNMMRKALSYDRSTFYELRMKAIVDAGGVAFEGSLGYIVYIDDKGREYGYPVMVSGHVLSMVLNMMVGLYDVNENLRHIERNARFHESSRIEGFDPEIWHSYMEWILGIDSCRLYLTTIGIMPRTDFQFLYNFFDEISSTCKHFNNVSSNALEQVKLPSHVTLLEAYGVGERHTK
jgi:hypothetical protein